MVKVKTILTIEIARLYVDSYAMTAGIDKTVLGEEKIFPLSGILST
jgi:hypothetical protein